MTRDEAIKKCFGLYGGNGAECVDLFVALGMLKLEEPKSIEQKFKEIYAAWPYGWGAKQCLEHLEKNGLKLVEK